MVMTDADVTALRAQLTRHEGLRLFPYRDTKGLLTIGIGRNLSGKGISAVEAAFLLSTDIDEVTQGLTTAYPWFPDLDSVRQAVLIDLGFMGLRTLATFTTFLGLMASGDWASAAVDLAGTAWYRQVGVRGPDLVQQLRTGAWV